MDEDTTDLARDVDEMERMVAEFLSFARDDASEVPEPTDVAVMIETCVANAHRAGRNVVLHGPLPRETLKMRPLAVQRALENLIGNAVRYGGQADVSAEVTGRSLRITVEDPGPGIPEDSREEALKPFSRLDPGRNQNKGSGVGLGLAIAGDVARTHGGRLELSESKRMGGLRADLVFPKGMSN